MATLVLLKYYQKKKLLMEAHYPSRIGELFISGSSTRNRCVLIARAYMCTGLKS